MNNHIDIETKIEDLVISILPKELNKDLDATIENKIMKKYGNKCYQNIGYIKKNSINVLKRSLITFPGSTSLSLMTCKVTIKCTVCRPYIGAIIDCHIVNKIDVLYLAQYGPLMILIRRSQDDKEELKIRQKVKVEVKKISLSEDVIKIYAEFVSKSNEVNYYEIPQTKSDIVFVNTIKYEEDLNNYVYLEDAGYSVALNEKKKERNVIQDEWRYIRDYINPYELIFPSKYYNKSIIDKVEFYKDINNIGTGEKTINNMISRAYFKLWEILHDQKENKWGTVLNIYKNTPINVLAIAEAPGGFLQCVMDSRLKTTNGNFIKEDKFRGISLESGDISWNSNILDIYKNKIGMDVIYGYGKKEGDLRDIEEHQYIKEVLLNNEKAQIIVADGGIDVSDDPYTQEVQNHKLLYSEIIVALSNQAVGGTFVMKCYDLYTILSIQYLSILKFYYDKVYVIKPELSRPSNSEKYIIAMNYNGRFNALNEKKNLNMLSRWEDDKYIMELLANTDSNILGSMKFINDYFSERQMMFIDTGIAASKKSQSYKNNQVENKQNQYNQGKLWCDMFGFPVKTNMKFYPTNYEKLEEMKKLKKQTQYAAKEEEGVEEEKEEEGEGEEEKEEKPRVEVKLKI